MSRSLAGKSSRRTISNGGWKNCENFMKKQDNSKRHFKRVKKSSFRNNDICNELRFSKDGIKYRDKSKRSQQSKTSIEHILHVEQANSIIQQETNEDSESEPDIVCTSINSQKDLNGEEKFIKIVNNYFPSKKNGKSPSA